MRDTVLVIAGVRAAATFMTSAWRGLWWALLPCAGAWALVVASGGHDPRRMILALTVTLVLSGLLYRRANPADERPIAIVIVRLAAVWSLTLAFALVLASLLLVVFLAAAYAVASAGQGFSSREVTTWAASVDPRGHLVLGIVGAVGVGAFAWAITRTSLSSTATVASGRVQVLSTWPLTRGLGVRLVAARCLLALPAGLAWGLAWRAASASAWILAIAAGLCIAGLWLPLNTGLMAYIYRRRTTE